MPSFAIKGEPTKPVELKDGAATVTVEVTNTAAQELDGTVLVKPVEPAELDWFTIAGEATRSYPAGGSQQVGVRIAPPAGTTPASYAVRIDAKNDALPDEDYTPGPTVAFVVPVPRPPVPWWRRYWWVFAIVLAIVLLAVVAIVVGS